jgi:putative ATPase
VPIHLRNAPTRLMKELGYGRGYRYAHDFEDGIVAQQNLPDNLRGATYYAPTDRGFEVELGNRLRRIREVYAGSDSTIDEGESE